MNIHKLYAYLFKITGFRENRMNQFEKRLSLTSQTNILDVGGTIGNWQYISKSPNLTLLNLDQSHNREDYSDNVRFQIGNALNLPFENNSFDIVYSNSVIEHVATWENQLRFANEASRVGKSIWVQTPAYEFFLEPHLITPFIHWLPITWRRRLLRYFTVWGWINRPSQTSVDAFLDEVRLISYKEMQTLFPDCNIWVEKWMGMPKSYVAYRQIG